MKKKTKKIYCYQSYQEDFVVSKNQSFKLPEDYKWIHDNSIYIFVSAFLYIIVQLISKFYCKYILHMSIMDHSDSNFRNNSGCFIYGNHTQVIGDIFIPVKIIAPKRCYILAGSANMGIPVLGSLLPILGALPVPDTLGKTKQLYKAISQRIDEGKKIIIYPEEHVWPWYTDIRPFPATSFTLPIENNVPAYCMTTTYHKNGRKDKPKLIVYIDGPFYSDKSQPKSIRKKNLCNDIYECMKMRTQNNTVEYIKYEKGGN